MVNVNDASLIGFPQQQLDPSLIGEGFTVSQEPDPELFGNREIVELDQRVATERDNMKVNAAAIAILAGGYAIAHEIDHELLYSNIWSNLLMAPSLAMSLLPIQGLVKNVVKLRHFRKQRDDPHFTTFIDDQS